MRTPTWLCLVVAAACASTHAGTFANRYYLTDLGVVSPEFAQGFAAGINDRGQITGGVSRGTASPLVPSVNTETFIWSPSVPNGIAGTQSLLALPTGESMGYPNGWEIHGIGAGINNFGQVIGRLWNFQSFLWTPETANGSAGSSVPIYGNATDLNDYGQIALHLSGFAGLFTPDAPNGNTGTTRTFSNTAQGLAINNHGDVGGDRSGGGGFIWRPAVANGTTGTRVNTNDIVSGMNDSGYSLGLTSLLKIADGPQPSVLEQTPLGTVWGRALAINDAGLVVRDSGYGWSAAEGHVDLNTRLEAHSGAGWTIASSRDINQLGQIVGHGLFDPDNDPTTDNSVSRPFLLTPLRDGDVNVDQSVDFDDLLALAQHYGSPSGNTWLTGDFNGDGAVLFDDLLALAQQYDRPNAFADDWALARALVPEPAAIGLIPGLSAGRRRRNG